MHKAKPVKKLFYQFAVDELDWTLQGPGLNPTQDLWDLLECRLRARHQHQEFNLANALVVELEKILAARLQQ